VGLGVTATWFQHKPERTAKRNNGLERYRTLRLAKKEKNQNWESKGVYPQMKIKKCWLRKGDYSKKKNETKSRGAGGGKYGCT